MCRSSLYPPEWRDHGLSVAVLAALLLVSLTCVVEPNARTQALKTPAPTIAIEAT